MKQMSSIVRGDELIPKLWELLGLPDNITRVDVEIPLDGAVVVKSAYFPTLTARDLDELTEIFAEFELVRIKDIGTLEKAGDQTMSDKTSSRLARKARVALAVIGVDAHEWPDEKVVSAVIRFGRLVAGILRNILDVDEESKNDDPAS